MGVPVGYIDRHMESGFVLADGTALLESEKDESGFYVGGAGMDGMFLRTNERYEPVRDENGAVTAFRRMSEYLPRFSAEEQALIFQYGMNTRDNLATRPHLQMVPLPGPRIYKPSQPHSEQH